LANIDADMVFAEYWTHPDDPILRFRHTSIKCAEVLVPNRIDPAYIVGAYVSNSESGDRLQGLLDAAGIRLSIVVDDHLFFLRRTR